MSGREGPRLSAVYLSTTRPGAWRTLAMIHSGFPMPPDQVMCSNRPWSIDAPPIVELSGSVGT